MFATSGGESRSAGVTQTQNLPDVEPVNAVEALDVEVADALVPFAQDGAVRLLGAVSDLSDQEPLYAAAAATLVTSVVLRDGRSWRAGTRILAAHLLATALRGVIKAMVDRTRPDAAARRGEYVLAKGHHRQSEFSSFPSGHAAGAVAFACAFGREYPEGRNIALGLAAAAGIAQVIRSKHYVTDVVAGSVIGWASETFIDAVIRRSERV